MENKNKYINSFEGAEIYNYLKRGIELENNYCGMIPFSLELIKLEKEGLKTSANKQKTKEISDDIINVKFRKKVHDGNYILQRKYVNLAKMNKQLNKWNNTTKKGLKKKEELKQKIKDKELLIKEFEKELLHNEETVLEIEGNKYEKWDEVSNSVIRDYLYDNGFNIGKTHYVVYKRSPAKSRTGQCLFINKTLRDEMIAWCRMYLNFPKDWDGDYAGLLSYESLVSSALEDIIKINPENILIIDDVQSTFSIECNIVEMNKEIGHLQSVKKDDYEMKNELFDGESLLESTYFKDGQGFMLLRNHMLKSAAFNCNIQTFLQKHCPEGINYDEWQIPNMFGQLMYAKDIHMICTPSSLKALKFNDLVGTKKDMWEYWKKFIEDNDNVFGICKHEKESKRGKNAEGQPLQQTSYQMLNSMPIEKDQMKQLAGYEIDYINKLKNDDEFFLNYLVENNNEINCNMTFVDLARHNKDFISSAIFRSFRATQVHDYVTHCRKGKIRLLGDYCIILGNPMEYLYHAIGKLDKNNPQIMALTYNQIYTKLYEDGKKLIGFRNPHTSPSNVFIAVNTKNDNIDKYFNLSKNIVCVNAIKFQIQRLLSGMDYDSDSAVLFDNPLLEQIGEKCFDHYKVCVNGVPKDDNTYNINTKNMYTIDNQLSTSQQNIGYVVNIGQLIMSTYWDLIHKGKTSEELKDLLEIVNIATVLSEICIDTAKRKYQIDIDSEINYLKNNKNLSKTKPMFFQYISESKTIKNRVGKYECPMDQLYEILDELDKAGDHDNINIMELIVKHDNKKADRRQEDKIFSYVEEMCANINRFNAIYSDDDEDDVKEKNNRIDDTIKYFKYYMQKTTVKPNTMYDILLHIINHSRTKISARLLSILHDTQGERFLNAFKKM